jgi:hypothetical protein
MFLHEETPLGIAEKTLKSADFIHYCKLSNLFPDFLISCNLSSYHPNIHHSVTNKNEICQMEQV